MRFISVVSSHSADQWVCQWVFPAQMSSCSERHQHCRLWTLHHLLEEVMPLLYSRIYPECSCIFYLKWWLSFFSCHVNSCMKWKLETMPWQLAELKKVQVFYISGNVYFISSYENVCLMNELFFLSRKSASAETSIVRSIITLPHVMVENIPLYVHAGQSNKNVQFKFLY